MKSLEGRVAVVTGGAKGLGRAIADELAKEGAHIARLEVEMSTAKESAEEIGARVSIRAPLLRRVRSSCR